MDAALDEDLPVAELELLEVLVLLPEGVPDEEHDCGEHPGEDVLVAIRPEPAGVVHDQPPLPPDDEHVLERVREPEVHLPHEEEGDGGQDGACAGPRPQDLGPDRRLVQEDTEGRRVVQAVRVRRVHLDCPGVRLGGEVEDEHVAVHARVGAVDGVRQGLDGIVHVHDVLPQVDHPHPPAGKVEVLQRPREHGPVVDGVHQHHGGRDDEGAGRVGRADLHDLLTEPVRRGVEHREGVRADIDPDVHALGHIGKRASRVVRVEEVVAEAEGGKGRVLVELDLRERTRQHGRRVVRDMDEDPGVVPGLSVVHVERGWRVERGIPGEREPRIQERRDEPVDLDEPGGRRL